MTHTPSSAATDDAIRSPLGIALVLLLTAGVCALPMIDAVRAVLGVSPLDVAVSMGVFVASMLVTTVVFHLWPKTRAYAVWDCLETAVTQAAVLHLVYASGRGDSFFWLLAFVHVLILGSYGNHVRFSMIMLVIFPASVGLAFWLIDKNLGAAALSACVGALLLYVYRLSLSVSRRLVASDAERARLADELAATQVRQDRQRIARDIHDHLGAELSALDWRLRNLRDDANTEAQKDIDEVITRLALGNQELRTIVWALRTPSRRWDELVAYLRQRATELCGDAIALEVADDGDGGVTEHQGELALDYLRIVLELLRNAVRHAETRELRLVLRSEPRHLVATLTDHGRGLPKDALERPEGGLANLRHRVTRVGGSLQAEPHMPVGTRFTVTLPNAPVVS